MDLTPLVPFVPVIGPIATALVAIVAIIVTRRSNQRNIQKDIELKKWESRALAYSDLVVMLDKQDPSRAPATDKLAREAKTGVASLTSIDLDGDEWRNVDTAVRLYSSGNVANLYWVWKRTFADWTFSRASVVINEGNWEKSTTTEREAFKKELMLRRKMVYLRREILLHVRSELDFRKRRSSAVQRISDREFSVTVPDGLADAEMEVFVGEDPDYAMSVRKSSSGWQIVLRLASGTKVEDELKMQQWRSEKKATRPKRT